MYDAQISKLTFIFDCNFPKKHLNVWFCRNLSECDYLKLPISLIADMNRATKTEKRKREKKSVISENNVRLFSQTAKALELVVMNPIIFFCLAEWVFVISQPVCDGLLYKFKLYLHS